MKINDAEIRSAVPGEVAALSELAIRSKAHWGYDAAFMSACLPELTLTPGYLEANPTFVLEAAGRPLAFYSFEEMAIDDPRNAELGLFFVDPEFIGRGLGRTLMEDALIRASSMGIGRLVVQSDPHAVGFYRAVGFVGAGERSSESLPGRMLPMLEIGLKGEG